MEEEEIIRLCMVWTMAILLPLTKRIEIELTKYKITGYLLTWRGNKYYHLPNITCTMSKVQGTC